MLFGNNPNDLHIGYHRRDKKNPSYAQRDLCGESIFDDIFAESHKTSKIIGLHGTAYVSVEAYISMLRMCTQFCLVNLLDIISSQVRVMPCLGKWYQTEKGSGS